MGFGQTGLSQSELAARSGLSLRSIQNWGQGHGIPRSQALLAHAGAVGVSVEWLLAGLGEQLPRCQGVAGGNGRGEAECRARWALIESGSRLAQAGITWGINWAEPA
jgi:transcriptional regulator with XRE-family HTH domain